MSTLLLKLVKASSMLHEAIGECQTAEPKMDSRSSQNARNLLNRVSDFWKKATESGALQNNAVYEKHVAERVLGDRQGKSFMTTVNKFMSGKSMPVVHKIIESRVNVLENAVQELKIKVQEHGKRLDKLEASFEEFKSAKAAAAPTPVCAQGQAAGEQEVRIKEQPLILKYITGRQIQIQVRYLEWDMKQLTEVASKHCQEDVKLVYAGTVISDKKYADVKLADMKLSKDVVVHVAPAAAYAKTDLNEDCEATVHEATAEVEEMEENEEDEEDEEDEEVEEAEEAEEAEEEVEEVEEHLPSTQTGAGASSSSCMWACNVCTFAENNDLATVCYVCGFEKGAQKLSGDDACGDENSGASFPEREAAYLKRKHSEIMLKDEKAAQELQKAWAIRSKSTRSKKV